MENKKSIIIISVILVFLLGLVVVIKKVETKKELEEQKRIEESKIVLDYKNEDYTIELDQYDTKNPLVAMEIENYGSVVFELYPDIAPETVNNFIYLVRHGFYENNTFHRLIPGFVLQGGDPKGTGEGGPDWTIKGEFKENGFDNDLKHKKGILSMARSSDPDSAGSQFFIVLDTAEHLDNNYAAFGKVLDGMEAIERIEKNEKVADPQSGQLEKVLKIKHAAYDLKDYEAERPHKIRK